jgi:hypothetical protein
MPSQSGSASLPPLSFVPRQFHTPVSPMQTRPCETAESAFLMPSVIHKGLHAAACGRFVFNRPFLRVESGMVRFELRRRGGLAKNIVDRQKQTWHATLIRGKAVSNLEGVSLILLDRRIAPEPGDLGRDAGCSQLGAMPTLNFALEGVINRGRFFRVFNGGAHESPPIARVALW